MSDIRFVMIGVAVIFAGFVILGSFGQNFQRSNIQANEFGDCFEYYDDKDPVQVDCSTKVFDQSIFFVLVISLIISGIVLLIKGLRGDWDNKVKPEDMVGPNKNNHTDGNISD